MPIKHPRLISLVVSSGNVTNPADATSYYVGSMLNAAMSTTEGARRIYVPETGRIISANINIWSSTGTAGTNENINVYLRKNATTDYLIQLMATTDVFRKVKNNSLNIPVSIDDWFEIRIDCPTWVTNPTNWIIHGTVIMSVP
jgi:hypothetical protein